MPPTGVSGFPWFLWSTGSNPGSEPPPPPPLPPAPPPEQGEDDSNDGADYSQPRPDTVDRHADALWQLLPQGYMWTRGVDDNRERLMRGLSIEQARLEELADYFLAQRLPHTTIDLLPEWESFLGLPGPCVPYQTEITTEQRHASIVAQLRAPGGPTIPFFLSIAEAMGTPVTIEECSDFNVNDSIDDFIADDLWNFVWVVHGAVDHAVYFTTQSGVDESLSSGDVNALECIFQHLRPAHTILFFQYDT